jgi:signal peptidase II
MNHRSFHPGQFFIFGLIVILAIVVADQYTKWLVLETMLRKASDTPDFMAWLMTAQPVSIFEDLRETYNTVTINQYLNFVMVWNRGISFGLFGGMLADNPQMLSMILIGVTMLIAVLLALWLAMARTRVAAWGLSLIIGGAIGNIIDRIRFGAVADFIDVHIGDKHWPAFNLADSCVVIGAILLILHTAFAKESSLPGA